MKNQYKKWMEEMVDKQNFCIWMSSHDLEEILVKAYHLAQSGDNWKSVSNALPEHNGRFLVLVQGKDLPPYVELVEYNGGKWQTKLDGLYQITHYQRMPEYHHLCLSTEKDKQ